MMPAPVVSQSDEFRHKSSVAASQASLAITQINRQQWLRLAEHWMELAEVTGEDGIHAPGFSPPDERL
jgi:hypothetical protein